MYILGMAEDQPCTCELCQPNWYLGRDGFFVEHQPVIVPADALEEVHARKLFVAQQGELAAVTG